MADLQIQAGNGNAYGNSENKVSFLAFAASQLSQDQAPSLPQEIERVTTEECKFPWTVFPRLVLDMIWEFHEKLNYPIDFFGSSILFASSVAIGNTSNVKVRNNWYESAGIYLALVGKPGSMKSHPLSTALKPIFDRDARSYGQYQKQFAEYEQALRDSKKNDTEAAPANKPHWSKHIVSDFTPEALATVLKFNNRGLGVHVDELAGWFKNFNRYNKGSEMEFWLSSWNGKQITIDRKSSEPILISRPFISVGGTIQNALIKELGGGSRSDNGFIDRILFAFPKDGAKAHFSEVDVEERHLINWNTIINNILSIEQQYDEDGNPEPKTLRLSEEARDLYTTWYDENADESNEFDDDSLSGLFSKFSNYCIRFSLILHMLRYACTGFEINEITKDDMDGAIKLVKYFKHTAIKVNSIVYNVDPLAQYSTEKASIYNALPETFTTKEGLEIATAMGMAGRTFNRFLTEKGLFEKVNQGNYRKIF